MRIELTDHTVLWAPLSVALLIAVATDVRHRRIPNVLTVLTAALALAFRFWRHGLGDLSAETDGLLSGAVASVGSAMCFIPWALKGKMGFGDVKLVGAAGAVFGWPSAAAMLLFVSLAGFFQAILTLTWRKEMFSTLKQLVRKSDGPAPAQLPFSIAIALGCFWTMWWELGFVM